MIKLVNVKQIRNELENRTFKVLFFSENSTKILQNLTDNDILIKCNKINEAKKGAKEK